MSRPVLRYAGGHLDRADARRKVPDWVAERLRRPDSRFVPVWRDRNLLNGVEAGAPAALSFDGDVAAGIRDAAGEIAFLGLEGEVAVFAADLPGEVEEEALSGIVDGGEWLDLRRVGPLMNAQEAALLAYARGITHWLRNHRFCSRCGGPLESRNGGHIRKCLSAECGRETYPRTDPAVIMLVEHVPANGGPRRALLGNHHRLPPGTFTTLAGFVEPGESLEEAVAREVLEESGITVEEVTYKGSQPWPFPASIMLGFWARAASTEITVDMEELSEAHWFTAEELAGFGEWGEESAERRLPRRDSIARFLINSWIEAERG